MSTDLVKLSYKLNSHDSFFVFGPSTSLKLLQAKAHKAKREIEGTTLVVITERDQNKVINLLKSIQHKCELVFWDFYDSGELIKQFLDQHASKFQYSKQMLINGSREKSLYAICSFESSRHTNNSPISVFLVLKTGGAVYDYKYVNATADNIRNNISHPCEIVCITDDATGITKVDRVVKFKHQYPKWWGKIELFRDDITKNDHCLFLDLDTVCLQSIDFLCKLNEGIYGIRDFYHLDTFQTGIMKWSTSDETAKIYHNFLKEDFSKYKDKGDCEWIGSMVTNKGFIQDEYPGRVVSYKKHLPAIAKGMISPSVVCFHGDPRPHTVKHDFITSVWKY